ncbi:MAG: ChaN family lipoprotein [Rhodocyclaceae bacterium]
MRRTLPLIALALAVSACASTPSVDELARHRIVLLGEVHDNAAGHQQRYALLKARVDAGWRPVIAMEQFDRERQPDLDAALARCANAQCVIQAAAPDKSGWQWPLYENVINLALAHRLRIVAANVSRADARAVITKGYEGAFDAATVARFGLDSPLPEDIDRAQRDAVDVGHCGKLPAAMLPGMARAQVARDVGMAQVVMDHSEGVVLLAGNGHVRKDIGVPRWIKAPPGTVWSMGFVEAPPAAGTYDDYLTLPAQSRDDPCAGL